MSFLLKHVWKSVLVYIVTKQNSFSADRICAGDVSLIVSPDQCIEKGAELRPYGHYIKTFTFTRTQRMKVVSRILFSVR